MSSSSTTTTSLSRRVLTLAAAASLVLPAGACKSTDGSSANGKGEPTPAPPAPPGPSSAPASDNGVAAKSAAVIARDAQAALRSAKAVHVKGRMHSGGGMVNVNLRTSRTEFTGFLSAPMAGSTKTFEVRQVKGKLYARLGQVWKTGGTPKGAVAPGALFTTIGLANAIKPTGRPTKGKPTKIGGRPAIAVRSSGSVLYVATTGDPYPLRFGPATNRRDAINFTEYGEPFTVTAPPVS